MTMTKTTLLETLTKNSIYIIAQGETTGRLLISLDKSQKSLIVYFPSSSAKKIIPVNTTIKYLNQAINKSTFKTGLKTILKKQGIFEFDYKLI